MQPYGQALRPVLSSFVFHNKNLKIFGIILLMEPKNKFWYLPLVLVMVVIFVIGGYLVSKYFFQAKKQEAPLIQFPTTTVTPPTISFVPGSCLLLDENNCQKVGLIKVVFPGTQFQIIQALAFNLPPGTPIFAPFETLNNYGLDYSFQDEKSTGFKFYFSKRWDSDTSFW